MAFSRVWLDDLVDRTDIVQIVSRHVQLTKRGNRYWGLCPFHMEKSASFTVNPQMQMYYCFGCHASGGAINFLMEMEHMEFKEAVAFLADEAHIPLPENFNREREKPEIKGQRERIYELNREYARFLHQQLWEPQNAEVLNYFHGRALTDRTIRKFGLGASPSDWDAGTRAMREKGFTDRELQDAGISLVSREGRLYDMFRGRAMFPIINARGQVLGFGGRTLGKDPRKYMNTGDTLVYNKRHEIFAANLLKKVRGLKRIILTEGYMDVITMIQAGVQGVVATLGTALTIEQARMLKRYAPEIWVSYDGDAAGQHAILRALDIFDAEHVPARVLDFPNGMDPDEYIRAYGAEGLDTLAPESAVSYRMLREAEKHDMSTKEGRTEYAIACARFLAGVKEPVELENYVQRLMIETGFTREVLLAQIGRTETMSNEQQAVFRRAARPLESRAKGVDMGVDAAERQLLSCLTSGAGLSHIRAEDFLSEENRRFAEMLPSGKSAARILEEIEDENERGRLAAILNSAPEVSEDEQMQIINDCLEILRAKKRDQRVERIKEQLPSLDEETRKEMLRRTSEMLINLDTGKEG